MTLNIGRQGWAGIALESTPGVGVSPTDYLQFTANTLFGQVNYENVSNATQNRIKVFDSVPTKKWGQGDLEFYLDSKMAGYFLIGAFGSVSDSTLTTGAYDHTITVNNSNSTPKTLTVINDRQGSTDQEAYYYAAVDQLNISVQDGFAMAKASLISNFPQTTTSGSATTASGTVYAFPSARFAFGATVAAADAAANLKPHDFDLNIKNNVQAVFRHGNILPDTINAGDFEMDASFKLYFENATDRNSYYNATKQAAELQFLGNNIAGGYQESIKFRWYRTRLESFQLETGLSNFYIEDVKMQPEYDNANSIAMDCVVRNAKASY